MHCYIYYARPKLLRFEHSVCFFSLNSSSIEITSRVRLTPSFSKCCRKKTRTIQSQIKFSGLWKNWVLCSSIIWPSNLVNNVSFKCSLLSQKFREKFLVLSEKRRYFYFPLLALLFQSFVLLPYNQLLGCCWGNNLDHPMLIFFLIF